MDYNEDKVFSSQNLHVELNEERKKKGLDELPAVNPLKGSTNTYARKDKSFDNAFDFFKQMIEKEE